MKPQNRLVEFANSSFEFWTCCFFLGGWGEGGLIWLMTTLLRRHREQYLQKSGFTRYLQYLRDVGPSCIIAKPTSRLCELDLGISEGFWRKLEIGWGEAFVGDDHPTVSRTPRTISPRPTAHMRAHATLNFCAEVWALGVLASPPRLLASLFLIRCCASSFVSVKTFLAAPAFCTAFTAFSYYPPTCGLAVSSPSSL